MLANDIIVAAQDYSREFEERRIPVGPALRAVGRAQLKHYTEIVRTYPESLAELRTIPLTDIAESFQAANPLGSGAVRLEDPVLTILDACRVDLAGGGTFEVELTTFQERLGDGATFPFPAISFRSDTIWFTDQRLAIGGALNGWEEYGTNFHYWCVPDPSNVTSIEQRLMAPDAMRGILTVDVALWMAKRLQLPDLIIQISGDQDQEVALLADVVPQLGSNIIRFVR